VTIPWARKLEAYVVTEKGESSQSRDSFASQGRRDLGLFVLVVLCTFLTTQVVSCAYYNTFYSARRYHRQAMRAAQQPSKSKSTSGTSTTATPPAAVSSQVSSLLDKAIEKCAKVISVYPKSKWVDDAVFLLGACYYEKREYDKAIKKFSELGMYYPRSPLITRAQFLTGMCYFGKKQYDQSSEILSKFVKDYPHSQDRETALYSLGEAYFDKKMYVEALPYYKLLAQDKKSRLYFETLSRIGECYFETAKYDSARVTFSTVVKGSPDDEQVLDALIKIGESCDSEKNFDGALKNYEEALGLAKDFGKTAVVRLKMAAVIAQKGDHKKAIEMYKSVVDEFPRTIQASEAQFRVGYIYEVNLEDLESASTAYERVKEHSSRSEFASLAELRSRGLAKLKEFNQAVQASEGEKAAESAFLIAELSLFQLGKPDKAIERYLSVEKEFPLTSLAPKSAYAAGYVFLHVKQDTASAVETFKRIIERFPESEYTAAAEEILTKLGVELPEKRPVEPISHGISEQKKPVEEGKIPEEDKSLEVGQPTEGKELSGGEKSAVAGKPQGEGTPQEGARTPEGVKPPGEAKGSGVAADSLRSEIVPGEAKESGAAADSLRSETVSGEAKESGAAADSLRSETVSGEAKGSEVPADSLRNETR